MTRRGRQLTVLVLLGALAAACAGDDAATTDGATSAITSPSPADPLGPTSTASTTAITSPQQRGVGVRAETFVDSDRSTPPSGDRPATDNRVLETLVFYPSAIEPTDGTDAGMDRAVADAEPGLDGAPYPLIIFSHGLGGTPEYSQHVIEAWTAAGFVVAAPRFPLSRPDNPSGPDGGDVQNQTGDVSFLIDELTAAAADPTSWYAGLIDGERIGAGGHSNGAITTIGVTLHTCCADHRINAALEFAGTASPFSGGEYAWNLAPPYLIVHGTDDELIAYENAVALYNDLEGQKGLLTIDGGGHGAMFDTGSPEYPEVLAVTTDFLRAYLLADPDALERLTSSVDTGEYPHLRFAAAAVADDVIPTTVAVTDRLATVDEATGLVDGQTVTVTWSGYTPEGVVNVVQCSDADQGASFCDLTTARILLANPTGSGSVELEIQVGVVGEGTCGARGDECVIAVNDSGLLDADATIYLPLTFAG